MLKKRSNRMLTQRAVEHVLQYVSTTNPKPDQWSHLNTEIRVDEDRSLTVSLLDNPIMRITRMASGHLDKVYVFSGGFYDNDGNPSGLTRERLNGLLAALGDARVIPQKVRVFIEHDYEMCYVGSGEQKVAFNKDYSNMVSIDAVADTFLFEDMTPHAR